jgi:hypothetical protein
MQRGAQRAEQAGGAGHGAAGRRRALAAICTGLAAHGSGRMVQSRHMQGAGLQQQRSSSSAALTCLMAL